MDRSKLKITANSQNKASLQFVHNLFVKIRTPDQFYLIPCAILRGIKYSRNIENRVGKGETYAKEKFTNVF